MNPDIKRVDNQFATNRCQFVIPQVGQCTNAVRAEGANFCMIHGDHHLEKKKFYNYQLERWQRRIQDKANSPALKKLNEELGLLRMMLETKLNACVDDVDLITNSTAIIIMVEKIQSLVTSIHKMENSLGELLSKNQFFNIADKIVTILSEEIPDKELLSKVTQKIAQIQDEE